MIDCTVFCVIYRHGFSRHQRLWCIKQYWEWGTVVCDWESLLILGFYFTNLLFTVSASTCQITGAVCGLTVIDVAVFFLSQCWTPSSWVWDCGRHWGRRCFFHRFGQFLRAEESTHHPKVSLVTTIIKAHFLFVSVLSPTHLHRMPDTLMREPQSYLIYFLHALC